MDPCCRASRSRPRSATWVKAGGTFVGERARGLSYARLDGLTATAPAGDTAGPGAVAQIDLVAGDPLTAGLGDHLFVTNVGDPMLGPGEPGTVGAYAAGAFFSSGDLPARARLAGTAAVLDQRLGAGHVVLFSFDPAFRADSDGSERLLANALLLTPSV